MSQVINVHTSTVQTNIVNKQYCGFNQVSIIVYIESNTIHFKLIRVQHLLSLAKIIMI